MDFMQYVNRQKQIIKSKHVGEEFLIINGEAIPMRPAEEIIEDIYNMDGLFHGGEEAFTFSREESFAL